ncbi:MAG TPA: DNA ligase D [Gemmatimonadales bacterium]|jgi:bifunctional non-homologous end joining protein LigD|nr:DNA ligase D [Gemmatimonadales bacterium]
MPRKPATSPLDAYRAKRSLERTPEPAGALAQESGRLFVVHQHAARRLHFDLRLEMEGVLRSWAVPKGPSYDTAEKRLAVHVEDHPLEYGDFEGLIPKGNYGAGAVIVWDRGRWIPIGDPLEGLAKGKLLFELHGYKLHGLWTLVKLKKSEKDWLLIKERDAWTSSDPAELAPESVLSGLTVEELGAGGDRGEAIRRELTRLGAVRKPIEAKAIKLMLAESAERPFSRKGWIFEPKLDGYRVLAARAPGGPQLLTRSGNDCGPTFPEVLRAVAALPFDRLVLDGEVVALDDAGRPSFQRLQGRARFLRAIDIRHAAVECPVTYYAFDLLGFEDFDLRALPLSQRKAVLRRVLPPLGALRYLEHVEEVGEALYQEAERLGLEGIVAKKADSPYQHGRSSAWLKFRSRKTGDFVVVGFTAPKGSRGGFGALQLADFVDGALVYAGRAGSGFSDKQLAEVSRSLLEHRRMDPPCVGPIPKEKGTTWVEPVLVSEVEYTEWTDEGLLRQPVFLRFRDDKRPEECIRSAPLSPPSAAPSPRGAALSSRGAPATRDLARGSRPPLRSSDPDEKIAAPPDELPFELTNLAKVFWPEDGYTKGDLIAYYRAVAPWLLPYLRNRPLVMTRYPDGIAGKSFFQKDAPGFTPQWVRTERMWSEDTQREIDYFICDDAASLLYVINLGCIPIHLWASRTPTLERPDWCVLDLDPKGAPFLNVVEVALAARELCRRIGLPVQVKTTGSTGLHLMIPLGRQCTHEQSRSLGELLARCIVERLPEIATIARQVSQRNGKVYVDYLQNGSGKLIVGPFSVRPLPGAPVSVPLSWREVNRKLDIRAHTIKTVPQRMRKLAADPLAEVLELSPDLVGALERLMKELG